MNALMLRKGEDGQVMATVETVDATEWSTGEVWVRMDYSSLNFKDGLAITGKGPVVRTWPMVAGIDGAGTVIASEDPAFAVGDAVVHNGWGLGETRWGCMAEEVRLPSAPLVKLPAGLTTRQAMAIGTAGYTAMLCVMALERQGVRPDSGEVLVTGASGGVGSVAVALLAARGYRVVASTGKLQEQAYLTRLGASEVLDRSTLGAPGKPLQKERWAAVVDSVGSHTLVNALAQTRYGGVVAACGLAQGGDLPATVMPFILRGVSLIGIDSVMAPRALRQAAWDRLAAELPPQLLDTMIEEVGLAEAPAAAHRLMAGQVRGRVLVRIGQSEGGQGA